MRLYELLCETHYNLSKTDKLESPLKSNDTITVYHNFRNIADAISVIQHGLSGASRANRAYSYESDNNPTGLFVSPDFKTIDGFGSTIIEFVAPVKYLEPPVWPGGSFTGQGGISTYWGHGREGTVKRRGAQQSLRKQYSTDTTLPDPIRQSDDPLLAYTLTQMGENQALFIGHLNPSDISRIFVRKDNRIHSWEEISREDFVQRSQKDIADPKFKDPAKRKIFAPNDIFDQTQFKTGIGTALGRTDTDKLLHDVWKYYILPHSADRGQHFAQFMNKFLWPKQMAPAYRWFTKTFGTGINI